MTSGRARADEQAAQSQDLTEKSLEELFKVEVESVYTASRHQQSVTDAPASVTVVTAEEIRKHGYRTLADVLRDVTGFYVSYDRNYTYVGVRGFLRPGDYNTRILLLVDGHRINDNVYDGAYFGREMPLDAEAIERVEIVRGPSSSLYGTSAFFAVINVISKRGAPSGRLQVAGEGGSFGSYRARAAYDHRFAQGLDLVLSASRYDSSGQDRLYFPEFDEPDSNRGVAEARDGEDDTKLFAKASLFGLTLSAIHNARGKGIPTGSFETVFNDPRARTDDQRTYADLTFEHKFASVDAFARVYYDHYRYDGAYPYAYDSSVVLFRDFARGNWWGAELKGGWRAGDRHNLTAGMEYRDNRDQDQGGYDEAPFLTHLDDQRASKVWALYVQDDLRLGRLGLSAGLRHDRYDNFGGTTNPRLAVIFHPTDRSSVKLLYGKAFRAPNAYELYYYGGSNKGNPALSPETIRTTELVFEQYLGEHARFSAALFDYASQGLIGQIEGVDGYETYANSGRVGARGLELEAEARRSDGLVVRGGYSHQKAHTLDAKEWLTNSPHHLAHLRVTRPVLGNRVTASLGARYTGRRLTLAGKTASDHVLADVHVLARRLWRGAEAHLSVFNLFDAGYGDPGSEDHRQALIPQDGRTIRIGLRYSF